MSPSWPPADLGNAVTCLSRATHGQMRVTSFRKESAIRMQPTITTSNKTKALKLLFVSSETSSLFSKMPSDQNNQCESECTPPQSQVETRNVENSCYDSLSPRADESSTPSGKPRRTGRSSSKEDQRRSTRERSPSPSWTRVGWALAPATKRSHSRQRPAPLGHALAQDLEEADSLKVNLSPTVAAHRGRRPSNAGPAALPEAASNEPQRPSAAGFNALLQALQI